jgi:hypothetical protein
MTKAGSETRIQDSQRHGSADPDPNQNVMDPQHCCPLLLASLLCLMLLSAWLLLIMDVHVIDVLCCTRSPCAVLGVPAATSLVLLSYLLLFAFDQLSPYF